jgi:acetylornithine/N-succinyldiaminopimelate aminotransferase
MNDTEPQPNPFSCVMDIAPRPPVVFAGGEGSWMTDRDGRKWLDFIQGWAVNCLGHSPKIVLDALTLQAGQIINCSPSYYNPPMVALCTRLAELSGLGQAFLASSGAEANEGAIKLARKWGAKFKDGAYEIITMDHGFHGRTLATMSASGKSVWDGLFEPRVPGFIKVPFGDIEAVKAAIGPKTVAVMLEPIQGESGVWAAGNRFLRELRALTHEQGLLLILDEVQTGIGRTGKMFAFEHAGIRPDILTLAKGIGAGVPLSALVAAEEVCCFDYGDQGGTYCGNALMAAVGLAVVEEVSRPAFLARVREASERLTEALETLSVRHGCGKVRGQGLLLALDLGRSVSKSVVNAAFRRGLLVNGPRPDSLRFMPALNVSDEDIAEMALRLDGALSDAALEG